MIISRINVVAVFLLAIIADVVFIRVRMLGAGHGAACFAIIANVIAV